jgi:hypothetical protein
MTQRVSVKHVGLASTTQAGTGITIPRGGTGGGGEYGEDINDTLRTFAILREPVAFRTVFSIAKAIFDNWFTLEGSNYRVPSAAPTETAAQPASKDNVAFDKRIQKQLDKINAKQELTRMAIFERGYGWAIIVLGFNDSAESLAEPKTSGELVEIKAYGPTQISVPQLDEDPNSERYGLPLYYVISRPGQLASMKVHYSRVVHFATRLIDHDWMGKSVLDAIWDDLTTLRNIRWGMGQTMYRYGSGFPDITFTGAEKKDIDDFIASGSFKDLSARTYFAHNEDQLLDFKGLQGHALDPMNYYLPPMEHISCGTGIPLAILRGVQAGALTGSQTDTSNLWSMISGEQSSYEDGIRLIIEALIGQETDFTFNWKGGFELDEQTKQQMALVRAQEVDYLWSFFKRNEIRKMIDPDCTDLSKEEGGDDLKGKSNGPQPEIGVNPLTGLPLNPDPLKKQPLGQEGKAPFDAKPNNPLEDKKIQEQIAKGDASYIITEITNTRKPNAVSS